MTIQIQAGQHLSAKHRMLAPKLFYFCFYAAGSALLPYLALYYSSNGMNSHTIGLLTGLPPLVTLVAAPLWGSVADITRRHRQLLLAAVAGCIVVVLSVSVAVQLIWLLPLIALYAFFSAPIIPLVDNTTLSMLGAQKERYGRQRVWGSIGWGVSAAVMGVIIQRIGLQAAFYGYATFMGIGLLVAMRLPVPITSIGSRYWTHMHTLLRNRTWTVFLLAVLSSSIAAGVYNNFLFLYLKSLGASATLMGFSLVVATISELPVFFYSDRMMVRWGARGVLLLSLGASVVRMFAYAAMAAPWFVLPINLLHGLTFSAMWTAGVRTADAVAPVGMGASAQGMFTGITFGLGAAAGALLGGFLYDSFGPTVMFQAAGAIVLSGFLFYFVAGR